ncbi:MAG TPA: TetR/AcrR family transcriptional regulator [Spirochaetales bacterium]|nr:TetR/AcrR family transcriptional regulator [Spirochaetales bacterium]HRY54682.1 TetR/AcrR family transcriptional regulator [Spirochaetia bacterium]HRZ63324.1 TetR/AcrR family transcriptional regulator [Spirochaetia bacterium]
MGNPSDDAAGRIVLAAVACIERLGIHELTVRDIAKEAGVNVAAVNYYFRSKDALIERVLRDRLDHFVGEAFGLLDDGGKPVQERAFDLLLYILNGSLDWPRMMQAMLAARAGDERFGTELRGGLRAVVAKLGAVLDSGGARAPMAKAAKLVAAVVLPGMLPGTFDGLPSIGLSGAGERSDFVRALLEG